MDDERATVFITSQWDEDEPAPPLGIYSTPERAMAAIDADFTPQRWSEQRASADGLRHWLGGSYFWVDEVFLDARLSGSGG
jgi:hypothetical protein